MTQDNMFARYLLRMHKLYKIKSAAYGSEPIAESGEEGIIIRMSDKLARLKMLRKNPDTDANGESIEDTLLDLAVYCLLMLVYRSGAWGKQ